MIYFVIVFTENGTAKAGNTKEDVMGCWKYMTHCCKIAIVHIITSTCKLLLIVCYHVKMNVNVYKYNYADSID